MRVTGRRFRPTLWPTMTTALVAALLIGLGIWQIERLFWKQELIAAMDERLHLPPAELPPHIDDSEKWRFRPVHVTGTFDHAHEIHIIAFSAGGEQGYLVITPMRRADGSGVLIARGWVPSDRVDPATRKEGQIEGLTGVTGIARPAWPQGWFVPDNDPSGNHWFWGDLPAMARTANLADPLPVFVEADATPNPGGLPIGGQSVTDLTNDHLQYAITWFALAIGVILIWFFYHWRRPDDAGADAP